MNYNNKVLLQICYEVTKDIYIDNIPYYHIIATTLEKSRTFKDNTYLISKIIQYSNYSLDDIDEMGFIYDYDLLEYLIEKEDEIVGEFAHRVLENEYARILLLTEHTEIWHALDIKEDKSNVEYEKNIVIDNKTRDLNLHSDLLKKSYKICGILGGLVFALRDYIMGMTIGLNVYIYDYEKNNVEITYFNHDTNNRTFKSKYTLSKNVIDSIKSLIYKKIIIKGYEYDDPEFALNQTKFDYWPNYKAMEFKNHIDDKKACFYRIRNDYYASKKDAPISKYILDVKDEIFRILIEEGAIELIDFLDNKNFQQKLF